MNEESDDLGMDSPALTRLGVMNYDDDDEDYDEGWDAILDNESDGWQTNVNSGNITNVGAANNISASEIGEMFVNTDGNSWSPLNTSNITTVDGVTNIEGLLRSDVLELGGLNVLNFINDMSRMIDKSQNEIITLEMESVNTTAEHYRLVERINSMEDRLRRLEENG